MESVLEILYMARARLAPETYNFAEWSACTCGQVYQAATKRSRAELVEQDEVGHQPFNDGQYLAAKGSGVRGRRRLYLRVLEAICEANEIPLSGEDAEGRLVKRDLAVRVSDATHERAEEIARERKRLNGEPLTEDLIDATLELYSKAIAMEEQREVEARLEVCPNPVEIPESLTYRATEDETAAAALVRA